MGAMLVRHAPGSAAHVRREIGVDLGNHGVGDDAAYDVTLVASELIGNAVRHGEFGPDSDVDVAWTIGSHSVLVSVADTSDDLPQPRTVGTSAVAGRGLSIVEALALAWGVESLPHGKRVWARIATG